MRFARVTRANRVKWILWQTRFWKVWILWKMRFWKCEFWEKWDFESVNFVKNEISKVWIFLKNEILELWIWSNMTFSKCEFLDKLGIFAPVWSLKMTFHATKNDDLSQWLKWRLIEVDDALSASSTPQHWNQSLLSICLGKILMRVREWDMGGGLPHWSKPISGIAASPIPICQASRSSVICARVGALPRDRVRSL